MKTMFDKVKKKSKWFAILWREANDRKQYELLVDFSTKRKMYPKFSENRIAYLVLKKYYSTTAMKCLKVVYKDL